MNKEILKLNPQLFAEGAIGGDTGAAGSAEAVGAETGEAIGQVAADNGADGGSEVEDRATRFQELINGEYKAEYQSVLENALSKRLKTSNKKLQKSEAFRESMTPLLQRLGTKYGLDPSDVEGILAEAEKDDSYYERYAMEHGMELSQAKIVAEAERITAAEEQRKANEKADAEFQAIYNEWLRQAEETRQIYPDFDFEYESTNEETGEQFRRLLNTGFIPVTQAYEIIHRTELMGGAMQYAYRTAKQETADARTARQNRPAENGTSSQHTSTFTADMTHLSKEERKAIKAAVSRGEKVDETNFIKFTR